MKKSIGIWNDATEEIFDFTIVSYEDDEYFDLFLTEQTNKHHRKCRLKSTVGENPEIFAWYIASILSNQDIEID
ncbi:hypothetical protein, partial [Burkholderia sp. BE24]|uniref:hypothetical protein n=1 Tax=Burkholderia sp. BE24 TaxID=2656643 RepID=UPI001D112853